MTATAIFRKAFPAIYENDIAAIPSLISNGGLDLRLPSPLQFASQLGRLEIMALLLDAGADINAVDENDHSACYATIRYQKFDAFRFLLARGANVSVSRPRDSSLLVAAAEFGNDRFAIPLLDAGASLDNLSHDDLISLMARSHSIPLLMSLLARNVDVSVLRDVEGRTILHHQDHHFEHTTDFIRAVVRFGGVDVNTTDNDGRTPLHYASMHNVDVVRTLVQLGANVDQQDATGQTALMCSWGGWGDTCIILLLALSTDVTLATVDGHTACHSALFQVDRLDADLLPMIVALGGNVDQPDNEGETPRMIAIRLGCFLPTAGEIDAARRRINKIRLDLVRKRALEICIGLQSLEINALQLCEIMQHAFGALGSLIAFHHWWAIATTVKHFRTTE